MVVIVWLATPAMGSEQRTATVEVRCRRALPNPAAELGAVRLSRLAQRPEQGHGGVGVEALLGAEGELNGHGAGPRGVSGTPARGWATDGGFDRRRARTRACPLLVCALAVGLRPSPLPSLPRSQKAAPGSLTWVSLTTAVGAEPVEPDAVAGQALRLVLEVRSVAAQLAGVEAALVRPRTSPI